MPRDAEQIMYAGPWAERTKVLGSEEGLTSPSELEDELAEARRGDTGDICVITD